MSDERRVEFRCDNSHAEILYWAAVQDWQWTNLGDADPGCPVCQLRKELFDELDKLRQLRPVMDALEVRETEGTLGNG